MISCIIAAIGSARNIHSMPQTVAHAIVINITKNGERFNDFPIRYGTSKLFSTCCIITYNIIMAITPSLQSENDNARAGSKANIGHMNGTNSITHAIIANENVWFVFIQNNDSIQSPVNVIMNMDDASNICHLIHDDKIFIIHGSSSFTFLEIVFGIYL